MIRPRGVDRSDERGIITVLVALSISAVCVFAALAIDLGNVAQTRTHAQNAVDNAAVSGAELLESGTSTESQVVSSVESYVQENFVQLAAATWDTCPPSSIPSGFSAPAGSGEDCVTFNGAGTDVNVAIPPQFVEYGFGRVTGVLGATVETAATAKVTSIGAPCVLCLLGPTGTTLSDTGSGTFTVTDNGTNAGIAVDSNSSSAGSITGSGSIVANGVGSPQIEVVGGTSVTGSGRFSPTPKTGAASVPDPLAALAAPSVAGSSIPAASYSCTGSTCPSISGPNIYGSISVTGSGSVTIPPGYYRSITVSGSGGITLEPGTYVLIGQFSVTGSGSVSEMSGGVFFYFTCGASNVVGTCSSGGQSGGSLSLTGSGSVKLSPTSSGTYAGLTIFYDRNNTAGVTITGSGGLQLSGTVYAKSSALTLTGSGGSISSMMIAKSTSITGSGSVSVNYNSSTNVPISGSAYLCSVQAGNC